MITSIQSLTNDIVPAFKDPIGIHRVLGRTITPPKMTFLPFSDYLTGVPNLAGISLKDIQPYDRFQQNIPILDQGQVGSCTAHGITTAVEKAKDLAGHLYVPLSPCSLYAQINNNQDRGSNPTDGIKAITYPNNGGICTLADQPNVFVHWDSISSAAKENALRFRIMPDAAYKLNNFEEVVIADYLGFAVVLTIMVGNNFNPGSNGIVGYASGPGNHCITGGEAYKNINGVPAYRFRNSWTTRWGINGCAWLTARHLDQQQYRELIAIKWVLVDPKDSTQPPTGITIVDLENSEQPPEGVVA